MLNNYEGNIDFKFPMRADTKEFLELLLIKIPHKRPNSEEALEHRLFTRIESNFDVEAFSQEPTVRGKECQTKDHIEATNREKNPSYHDIDPEVLKTGFFNFGHTNRSHIRSFIKNGADEDQPVLINLNLD